ncbi:hypothetical protein ACQR1I_11340 [Bradyrhizobium sp. HKCCYLS2038]|uniref:hypothetical protein n=1 Tax=unclassified Bradyrhizobium TaxID=2631580 RepID=UPI003EBB43F6
MLKTMSVALLAASILAAPAFAAGPAKTDASAKSTQTTGAATIKTDAPKAGAKTDVKSDAKTDAKTGSVTQAGDKVNETKPTVDKPKGKPHASLLRHKHRHVAHLRHHHNVKVSHAAVKTSAVAKAGIDKTGIETASHKKVSFKRVTPATRRG